VLHDIVTVNVTNVTVIYNVTLFSLLLSSKVRNKRKKIIKNKKDLDRRRKIRKK